VLTLSVNGALQIVLDDDDHDDDDDDDDDDGKLLALGDSRQTPV